MSMPICYVAAPSADLDRARRWIRWLVERDPDTAYIAPWIVDIQTFNDADETQRAAGLRRDKAVIERCDRVVLVGGRISAGMKVEREYAEAIECPVTDLTHLGDEPPAVLREEIHWCDEICAHDGCIGEDDTGP